MSLDDSQKEANIHATSRSWLQRGSLRVGGCYSNTEVDYCASQLAVLRSNSVW